MQRENIGENRNQGHMKNSNQKTHDKMGEMSTRRSIRGSVVGALAKKERRRERSEIKLNNTLHSKYSFILKFQNTYRK